MAQQSGSSTQIIIDTETTFGSVPAAPNAFVLPFVSESLRQSRTFVTSKTIHSNRNPSKPARGNVEVSGDINFELAPEYGLLFKHIFGSVSTSGSGPYNHTFKIAELPVSMIVEKAYTNLASAKYFRYLGCRVNSFKLSARTEGAIDCSVSLMGKKEVISGESFDATETDLGHTPFDSMDAEIYENNAILATITEIDFTLENGLDGSNYVIDRTGQRRSLPSGTTRVSGNVRAVFEDTTLYDKAIANTETIMKIVLLKGSGAGTVTNEKFELVVPELYFSPNAPVVTGPAGVVVELPFEGFYSNDAEASAMYAVLSTPSSAAQMGIS